MLSIDPRALADAHAARMLQKLALRARPAPAATHPDGWRRPDLVTAAAPATADHALPRPLR
jgi:hypothetical protein